MRNCWRIPPRQGKTLRILFNNVGKKTVDQYWNRMKSVYGADYRPTDQEIFAALKN